MCCPGLIFAVTCFSPSPLSPYGMGCCQEVKPEQVINSQLSDQGQGVREEGFEK